MDVVLSHTLMELVARWVHFLRLLQNNKCVDAVQVACFTVFEFTPSFSSLHQAIVCQSLRERLS